MHIIFTGNNKRGMVFNLSAVTGRLSRAFYRLIRKFIIYFRQKIQIDRLKAFLF